MSTHRCKAEILSFAAAVLPARLTQTVGVTVVSRCPPGPKPLQQQVSSERVNSALNRKAASGITTTSSASRASGARAPKGPVPAGPTRPDRAMLQIQGFYDSF